MKDIKSSNNNNKNYQSPTNNILTTPITKNKRIMYKLAINKNINFNNENELKDFININDSFIETIPLDDNIKIKDITNIISKPIIVKKQKRNKKIVNKHFGFEGIN